MPVQVSLKDETWNRTRQAKLAENAPMSKLIPKIVNALGYPASWYVTYRISFNGRQLEDSETLASAGVRNGDPISIIPEILAEPARPLGASIGIIREGILSELDSDSRSLGIIREGALRVSKKQAPTPQDSVSSGITRESISRESNPDGDLIGLNQENISRAHSESPSIADQKPENTIFILPVKLEEVDVPERLSRLKWVNLYERNGFEELVRSLEAIAQESDER